MFEDEFIVTVCLRKSLLLPVVGDKSIFTVCLTPVAVYLRIVDCCLYSEICLPTFEGDQRILKRVGGAYNCFWVQ